MTDNMKNFGDVRGDSRFEEYGCFSLHEVKDGVYALADMKDCNPSDVILLPNNSVRFKDFVIEFRSKFCMETELPELLMSRGWVAADKILANDCIPFIRPATNSDYTSPCQTMIEALKAGIDFVLRDDRSFGHYVKIVDESVAPLFVMEAYGMEDCMYCARADLPDADKDELFDYYVAMFGMPWWYKLVGYKGYLELLAYYYDRQYPRMLEREKQKAK